MHLRLALNSWPRFLYLQVLRLQIPHTTMSGFAWFSGRPQSQRHSYRFLLFMLSPLDPLCSLFHFEFWFVFLSFYFYLAYGCSVYAPCVCRALLKPEESIKSRGLEFLKVVSRHVSTGDQTQILWNRNQCSYPLSHPFSPTLSFNLRLESLKLVLKASKRILWQSRSVWPLITSFFFFNASSPGE